MAVTVTQKIYKLTSDTVNRVFNCSVSVPTKGGVAYNDTQIRADFAEADALLQEQIGDIETALQAINGVFI